MTKCVLTQNQVLALSSTWITDYSSNSYVKLAMRAGSASFWAARAEDAFIYNDTYETGRPVSWRSLAHSLQKNAGSTARYNPSANNRQDSVRSDLNIPTMTEFQRICFVLGIDATKASPENGKWVGDVARWLVRIMKCEGDKNVTEVDYDRFGHYMSVQALDQVNMLDSVLIDKVKTILKPGPTSNDITSSVLRAAEFTGIALLKSKVGE